MADNERRQVNYPGANPENSITTWSLMYGAALTLAGQNGYRSLSDDHLKQREALLTAAAWLDFVQLSWTDGYGRSDLAKEAFHIAKLLRDHDGEHSTSLAHHGETAPAYANHELTDVPRSEDWSDTYVELRYLRREWAVHSDLR
ncbi:hypothetical protein [Streptomyces sp. NBC_00154]|uniref:hypothetical protein n=1 Tax=Streptomyces sp. NBC_00154 TaxID=2975670 RepID=UPI002250EEB6|nr:hypothetical protein [Streptomyces sp. NBC_00154]MCX5315925.1 hypothetical protein [Streptomyces sp. NBC_00154]